MRKFVLLVFWYLIAISSGLLLNYPFKSFIIEVRKDVDVPQLIRTYVVYEIDDDEYRNIEANTEVVMALEYIRTQGAVSNLGISLSIYFREDELLFNLNNRNTIQDALKTMRESAQIKSNPIEWNNVVESVTNKVWSIFQDNLNSYFEANIQKSNRYLDLMKNCLLDNIYGSVVAFTFSEEETHNEGEIATSRQVNNGRYWPERAHTMIGMSRLNNLQQLLEKVIADDIEGDFLETGAWRGGASIFAKSVIEYYNQYNRRVFVADSFDGLPPPDPKYEVDSDSEFHTYDFLKVSLEEVVENFRRYDLFDDRVIFLPGYFEHTMPIAPIDKLAILRLDGDMYSSTIQVLDAMYDKVSVGGFIIVDDYVVKHCRAAITDFRKARGINTPMVIIDYDGVYWRKEQ